MKKKIVCFGDSNTYGYHGLTGGRYGESQRWTGLLAKRLGGDFSVIPEGLNGRTVLPSENCPDERNGPGSAVSSLEKHRPVTLLVLMLGTNDTKNCYHRSADAITKGMIEIIQSVHCAGEYFQNEMPRILLIAPVPVREGEDGAFRWEDMGPESARKSRELLPLYENAARRYQCHFLRAGDYACAGGADGVHLDEEGHKQLAAAVAQRILTVTNPAACPCVRAKCPRRGDCGSCLSHHNGKRPPYCERKGKKAPKPAGE